MLSGCMGLGSISSLVNRLQALGFHGELDVYDLSGVPLALIDAYKKAGFWKGINIRTFQRDLAGLNLGTEKIFNPKEEGNYDLIIIDVLIHYLSDKDAEGILRFFFALRENGLILLRDMANLAEPNNKLVTKDNSEEYRIIKSQKNFMDWLEKHFGIKTTIEEIEKMRKRLFSKEIPHSERILFLSSYLEYIFNHPELRIIYKQLSTPATQVGQRIFPIFVFQKCPQEVTVRNRFLFNPQRSAMALEI